MAGENKLKGEVVSSLIGVLIGLPAIGLLIPNVFETLQSVSSGKLGYASLFKIFSIVYFTIPFFILHIMILFFLKDEKNIRLDRGMGFFVVSVLALMLLAIFIHTRDGKGAPTNWLIIFLIVALCLLSVYTYILWFSRTIFQLSRTRPDDVSVIVVRYNLILLFIPIQWVVAVLITTFPSLLNSNYFLLISGIFYLTPLYINMVHPRFRQLKREKMASKRMVPAVLAAIAILLVLLQYFSQGTNSWFSYNFVRQEEEYDGLFDSIENTGALDSSIRRMDQLIGLAEMVKTRKKFLKEITKAANVSHALDIPKDKFGDSLYVYGDGRFDAGKRELYRVAVDTNLVRDTALRLYRSYLKQRYDVERLSGKDGLLALVKLTQKNGTLIFLSILILLTAFLFLSYLIKPEPRPSPKPPAFPEPAAPQESPVADTATRPEATAIAEDAGKAQLERIHLNLQMVLIVVALLFIPLLKHLDSKDVDPAEPWKLFQLRNWNLSTVIIGSTDSSTAPPAKPPTPPPGTGGSHGHGGDSGEEDTPDCCCCKGVEINFGGGDSSHRMSDTTFAAELRMVAKVLLSTENTLQQLTNDTKNFTDVVTKNGGNVHLILKMDTNDLRPMIKKLGEIDLRLGEIVKSVKDSSQKAQLRQMLHLDLNAVTDQLKRLGNKPYDPRDKPTP